MRKPDNVVLSSIVISICYCILFMTMYLSWEDVASKQITWYFILLVGALVEATIIGGLIGAFIQDRMPYNIKAWKCLALLLMCNLTSPLVLYILMNFQTNYD